MELTTRQIVQARNVLHTKGQSTVSQWGSAKLALQLAKLIRALDQEFENFTDVLNSFSTEVGFTPKSTEELAELEGQELENYRELEKKVIEYQRALLSSKLDVDLPKIELAALVEQLTLNELAYLEPVLNVDCDG